MKGASKFIRYIGIIAVVWLTGAMTLFANNGDENFFDYLPKYRKFKSHYQIDKIEYRDKRTIIYFRFVVQNEGLVSFFSGSHPDSWFLRTPPRMRGIEVQFKLLEIRDIRINNELKLEALTHVPEVDYETVRGDVITCEMHFVRIPNYIRMLDLIQGKNGDMDQSRLNCFDILVKTKESPMLGEATDSDKTASRMEESFPFVQPKVKPTTLSAAEREEQKKQEEIAKTNGNAPYKEVIDKGSEVKPIDYRPLAMSSMNDLSCNKRVILPSITFKEDEVRFTGRVKAMQDIKILYDYLNYYHKAKIILHGHTDTQGNDIKNLELSRERAMAVKLELVKMGVERDRIEILFYGGKQPLKGLEAGGDENRRVEAEAICQEN